MSPEKNIRWYNGCVNRTNREHLNGHKSAVLWFTGLSAAGKSTLVYSVEEGVAQEGSRTFVLVGDNIRHGLSYHLSL